MVIINTPRTQAAIGTLSELPADSFSDLEIHAEAEFGVISLNSLDDQPIGRSCDLWITVVSEARNSEFSSREENNAWVIENMGTAPVLMQSTPARIFIQTEAPNWRVEKRSPAGEVLGTIPYQHLNGQLSFEIGTHGVLYYRAQCSTD
jgi:hypothetical protein